MIGFLLLMLVWSLLILAVFLVNKQDVILKYFCYLNFCSSSGSNSSIVIIFSLFFNITVRITRLSFTSLSVFHSFANLPEYIPYLEIIFIWNLYWTCVLFKVLFLSEILLRLGLSLPCNDSITTLVFEWRKVKNIDITKLSENHNYTFAKGNCISKPTITHARAVLWYY